VLVECQWVAGEPTVTEETQTRPLTDEEIESCKPDDLVTETPWTDGQWECGDTTVIQTRTVTVTTYTLVDGQWVAGTPSVTQESRPRELAEDEQFACVEPRIDVAAFSPVCQADIPYIQYSIEVSGTPNTTATITLLDSEGDEVGKYTNQPFSGKLIYPGASADPVDWPGWKYENGFWVEDPSDANYRQGLTVKVEVNPTATATVTYPPASAACYGPTQVESQPPTTPAPPGQQPPTTSVPTVQDPGPTTTVAPVTQLPKTGSNGTGVIAGLGLLLLGAGALIVAGVRRPRQA
jgi:LPXTG-motif cell wall-anchored protein